MTSPRKKAVFGVFLVAVGTGYVLTAFLNCRKDLSKQTIGNTLNIRKNKEERLSPANHRLVNKFNIEYTEYLNNAFRQLVEEKVDASDHRLVALVRELLDPPSSNIVKPARRIVHTPQSKEVDILLKGKRGGFFIECGAMDGERSSNTLYFEQKMGWSGLLVEIDPYYYTQLLGKSRRAWSINACLSPDNSPTLMKFKGSSGAGGSLMNRKQHGKQASMRTVPCFPLTSLMIALNQTRVDFFSLDVEGWELDILKTVPFSKLDITVLTVEYVHGRSGKLAYKSFMEGKGYKVHKDIHFSDVNASLYVDDYIFIKKDGQGN